MNFPITHQQRKIPKGAKMQKIMLVEDDESIRIAMTEALNRMGYEVLPAIDGSDGQLAWLLNRKKIDLIITDYDMPKTNGVVMLEKILAINPKTKAIIVSGTTEEIDLSNLPGVRILKKPVDLDKLKLLIKELLNQT